MHLTSLRPARLWRLGALLGLAFFAVLASAGAAFEVGSRERVGEEEVHAADAAIGAQLVMASGGSDDFDTLTDAVPTRVTLSDSPVSFSPILPAVSQAHTPRFVSPRLGRSPPRAA